MAASVRTLSLIVRESGCPLDVTLVGPAIAARLKLDTGGAADFGGATVDAARAKMRVNTSWLETVHQLERKPPKIDVATTPQFWVVDEETRPARLGLVGRDQLLAVGKVLLADTAAAEGSDVAMSSTLYSSLLDFEVANGEATTTVDALHDVLDHCDGLVVGALLPHRDAPRGRELRGGQLPEFSYLDTPSPGDCWKNYVEARAGLGVSKCHGLTWRRRASTRCTWASWRPPGAPCSRAA